jgi:hypothetical protein
MRTLLKIRLNVNTFNDTLVPQSGIHKELSRLGCYAVSTGKLLPTFRRSVLRNSKTMGNLQIKWRDIPED